MQLAHLWLTDFRGHEASEVEVGPGMTVFAGGNAQGKTTVLEAVGWLARMSSFRGAPDSALVRVGCERAIVRAEIAPARRGGANQGPGEAGGGPDVRLDLIEAEIAVAGRNRVLLNRKPLPRARTQSGFSRGRRTRRRNSALLSPRSCLPSYTHWLTAVPPVFKVRSCSMPSTTEPSPKAALTLKRNFKSTPLQKQRPYSTCL